MEPLRARLLAIPGMPPWVVDRPGLLGSLRASAIEWSISKTTKTNYNVTVIISAGQCPIKPFYAKTTQECNADDAAHEGCR